jgi:hypothetical protein
VRNFDRGHPDVADFTGLARDERLKLPFGFGCAWQWSHAFVEDVRKTLRDTIERPF